MRPTPGNNRRESEPAPAQRDADYVEELRELRRQIENTRRLFGMENDEDLLDAAIYQMKALQARQRYLLKRARGEAAAGNKTAAGDSAH